jgi:hypothetical protein
MLFYTDADQVSITHLSCESVINYSDVTAHGDSVDKLIGSEQETSLIGLFDRGRALEVRAIAMSKCM